MNILGLVHTGARWYLVAFDLDREALRRQGIAVASVEEYQPSYDDAFAVLEQSRANGLLRQQAGKRQPERLVLADDDLRELLEDDREAVGGGACEAAVRSV